MGDNILFGPTPDDGYGYSMTYYKSFDALADNAQTNWLILNAPDLYLYGTLLQAEPFLMNDERVPLWERGVRQVINDLQQQDCLLYTSPSPRDATLSRMPSSA